MIPLAPVGRGVTAMLDTIAQGLARLPEGADHAIYS
jgi:hypothetical protein